jgi:histidine triad (HIT) family protein
MVGNTSGDCVFCRIIAGKAPATVVRRWSNALAIVPRDPVTAGHVLVIPTVHVSDAGVDPAISAQTMAAAAELAAMYPDCNVITSRGKHATQTVFHLHIHVVPRCQGDGLALPWSPRGGAA